jgi:colicin import membrane protein
MTNAMIAEQSPAADTGPALLENDPFEYGWREVRHTLPNGETRRERIPLTLKDILHPQVGDFRLHTDEHERFCIYLYNILTMRLANDPLAVVLHDTRVAWGDPEIEPHGPDIAVIFNVRQRHNWSTFDCAEAGTKPALIIEVTSPKTRSVDLDDKVDEYEQVGVAFYVIVDIRQRGKGEVRQLLGRRLTPEGYVLMVANEQGWLWLEPVKLWLGIRGTELACYDENGAYIEGHLAAVARRAEAEAKARAAAEARLHEVEAELRRLRAQKD